MMFVIALIGLTFSDKAFAYRINAHGSTIDTCKGPSWAELKWLFADGKITTINDFFSSLKGSKATSEFFDNFVLIPYSLSGESEDVDIENPRVIMHQGTLFMAFTGKEPKNVDKAGSHYGTVQVFEFLNNKFYPRSIEQRGNSIEFIDYPEGCEKCHGNPPKPNWPGYGNLWWGSFGAHEDQIWNESIKGKVEQFAANSQNHPRYKYLNVRNLNIADGMQSLYFTKYINGNLTRHLFYFNYLRIKNQIINHPKYKLFKNDLNKILKSSFSIEVSEDLKFDSSSSFAQTILAQQEQYYRFEDGVRQKRNELGLPAKARNFSGQHDKTLAIAQLLLGYGLDVFSWPMTRIPTRYDTVIFNLNDGSGGEGAAGYFADWLTLPP